MRTTILALLVLALPSLASAQDMSAADRTRALERVRALAACVAQHRTDLERILALVREAEQQRERARDDRVRRDADAAIEALIARAAGVQRQARACVGGADLPSPGTSVVEHEAPPDPSADAIEDASGTVRAVEQNAPLSEHVHVVVGEQVDGGGTMDAAHVRAAMRSIAPRLERCAAGGARQLELVFTFRNGSPRASGVTIEGTGSGDALASCVRQAGQALRVSRGPYGGVATFSYRLRFGG
jgi:hypothetical protein